MGKPQFSPRFWSRLGLPRPGNPYLGAVLPLLQSIAASGGFLPELEEKKHVISQDSWRLVKIEPEVQDTAWLGPRRFVTLGGHGASISPWESL